MGQLQKVPQPGLSCWHKAGGTHGDTEISPHGWPPFTEYVLICTFPSLSLSFPVNQNRHFSIYLLLLPAFLKPLLLPGLPQHTPHKLTMDQFLLVTAWVRKGSLSFSPQPQHQQWILPLKHLWASLLFFNAMLWVMGVTSVTTLHSTSKHLDVEFTADGLFVMEDKWVRPSFNIICWISVDDGLGNSSITQSTIVFDAFCDFFGTFCVYFADNTKIQTSIYGREAKLTPKLPFKNLCPDGWGK